MRNFNALVDGIQYTNENENVAKISESTIFQSCDLQLNGENPCRLAVFGGNLYVHDHIDSLLSRNLGPTTRAAWIESHDGRTSLFLRINEDTQGGYKDKTQTVKILTTEILTEFDWNSGDILYEKHTNHYDDGTDGDGFMIDAQTSEGLKLVCYGEEFPPDIQPAYDLAMSLIDNITNNLKNLSWASVIYHREIKKKIIWIRFPSRL